MASNVDSVDRVRRLTVGLFLGGLGYAMQSDNGTYVAICIGAVLALTTLAGSCHTYRLLGISTCRRQLRGT